MPDYMYMLESRLSAEQRAAMVRTQELAAETGINVYLTGGAVRDLISGMPIRDLDFTVEGNPSRLARELEKGGARTVAEDEKLRYIEMIFPGDVDGSLSAAREDVYARPGTRPEIRWSTIMEDLRRRDFSLNAIAISLNPASRGLLLDPTNGLSDIENREIRALSIHSFTNQPGRLLRAIRYCARMDFKLGARTEEWFALALERKLAETITPEEAGRELRQVGREDKPVQILKAWEARGLIGAIHPQLEKRHPHYEMLARIIKARDDLATAGLHPRLVAAVTFAVFGKLKGRERAAALNRLEYSAAEAGAVAQLEEEMQKTVKILAGHKTASPGEAFAFLEKAPAGLLAFILAEASNSKAINKIRNYLHKWKPLRQALPAAVLELESLGLARGPKFDMVIEDFFQAQLLGKARAPEDRILLLRKLSGIKEQPKKEEKKKPPEKPKKKATGKEGSAVSGTPVANVAAAPSTPGKPGKAAPGQGQLPSQANIERGKRFASHAAKRSKLEAKKPAARPKK